ncbi:hypothetical protein OG349_25690 [Streptomyces sp. NBC_01317]|uniref:hypothetical protein n=1 Tax=Streptomyces sp. NBC_01317 TaxID=2903822 RepID=UPI002E108A61|nr:hypothetical protein OG349_25690 [Streptomyces sp. NBC_01317]
MTYDPNTTDKTDNKTDNNDGMNSANGTRGADRANTADRTSTPDRTTATDTGTTGTTGTTAADRPTGPPATPEVRDSREVKRSVRTPETPSRGTTADTDRDATDRTTAGTDRTATGTATRPSAGTTATDTGKAPTSGKADHTKARFFPQDESDKLNQRLQDALSSFVDGPRRSVEEAAGVLEETAERLSKVLAERPRSLRADWDTTGQDKDGGKDTEDLRLALQSYREVTERLLRI